MINQDIREKLRLMNARRDFQASPISTMTAQAPVATSIEVPTQTFGNASVPSSVVGGMAPQRQAIQSTRNQVSTRDYIKALQQKNKALGFELNRMQAHYFSIIGFGAAGQQPSQPTCAQNPDYILSLEKQISELQKEIIRTTNATSRANLPASWGVDTPRDAARYMLKNMKEDSYSYFVRKVQSQLMAAY
jgi:hypothetical protein